jgi:hypothetical protein
MLAFLCLQGVATSASTIIDMASSPSLLPPHARAICRPSSPPPSQTTTDQEVALPTDEEFHRHLRGGMKEEDFRRIQQDSLWSSQGKEQRSWDNLWAPGPASMPSAWWPSMLIMSPAASQEDDHSFFSSSHVSSLEEDSSHLYLLSASLLQDL